MSKNAIGNLIAKYRAVLKKCALINFMAAGVFVAIGSIGALAETKEVYKNEVFTIDENESFRTADIQTMSSEGVVKATGLDVHGGGTAFLVGKTIEISATAGKESGTENRQAKAVALHMGEKWSYQGDPEQATVSLKNAILTAKGYSASKDVVDDEAPTVSYGVDIDRAGSLTVSEADISALAINTNSNTADLDHTRAKAVALRVFSDHDDTPSSATLENVRLTAIANSSHGKASATAIRVAQYDTVTLNGTITVKVIATGAEGSLQNLFQGSGTVINNGRLQLASDSGSVSLADFKGVYRQEKAGSSIALDYAQIVSTFSLQGGSFSARLLEIGKALHGTSGFFSVSGGAQATLSEVELCSNGSALVIGDGGSIVVEKSLKNSSSGITLSEAGSEAKYAGVSVEKGGTLSVAGDFDNAAAIRVKHGAKLIVEKAYTLTAGTNSVAGSVSVGSLALGEGTITLCSTGELEVSKSVVSNGTDKKIIIKDALTNKDATKIFEDGYADAIVGEGGVVIFYLSDKGSVATEKYTSSALRKAADELFTGSETGAVVFANGLLELEGNDSVRSTAIKGSDGKYEIGLPGINGNSQAAVVKYTDRPIAIQDESGNLLTAEEVGITNKSFTVSSLQANVDEMKLDISGSTLSFSAETPVVNKDKEGVSSGLNLTNGATVSFLAAEVDLKGGQLSIEKSSLKAKAMKTSDIAVKTGGKIDVKALSAKEVSLEAGLLNIEGDEKERDGKFSADSLRLGKDSELNIKRGIAQLGKLSASHGASFYIDPSYVSIDGVEGTFGGVLAVADGSVVSIAGDGMSLQEFAQKAGMNLSNDQTLGTGESMLVLGENLNLDSDGKIIVDASVQSADEAKAKSESAYFGNNSLLVINGNKSTNQAAISIAKTDGTVSIAPNAKLYIANAQLDESYFIVDSKGTISSTDGSNTGWNSTENLLTDSDMLTGTFFYDGDQKGWVAIRSQSATIVYPQLDGELVGLVNTVYENGLNDVDSSSSGIKFLSRATHKAYLGNDKNAGTQAIESASRIAMAGAVPQMSIMASETLSDAMGNRMNLANGYNLIQEQSFKSGLALWITPVWKNQSGFGMEACKLDYGFNANIGGVALGADYSFSESVKAGLAFNIGGGYAKSSGDLSSTENHMNFWGIGVYGGYNDGRLSVMGDASYTSSYNKLEQDLNQAMQMQNLKADVRAAVWSAGIRGDYKVTFDALDLTPHLGVRYTNISSQGYDIKGGGTVAKSDGFQQSFWSIPVGVTFGKDFKTSSGWSITPSVDFTVTPRFGDLKAYESIRFTGVPREAGLHTQTRDYVSYKGTASIGAKYNNIGLNLNYSYEAGSRTSGHGVNASFRWEF